MRLTGLALVLLLAAAPAPARAQDPAARPAPPADRAWVYDVTGTLDGRPVRGVLTVRRAAGQVTLEAVFEAPGPGKDAPAPWRAAGARHEAGWRFELPPTVGLVGALQGRRGPIGVGHGGQSMAPPREALLRAGADHTVEGVVRADGQIVGRLRGAERPPAPATGECKPVRDRWYARHGVAVWELGRSLWDFYKPGSRRLEELRGDVTVAQTRRLRERLELRPKPWTPETIYAEARASSPDAASALRLAFGLTLDDMDLPLRQLPGIESRDIHDKYEHFFASAILARRGNARGSFGVGWLKEVMDEVSGGTGYDEDDLMADAQGAEFGQSLQCE